MIVGTHLMLKFCNQISVWVPTLVF